MASPTSSSSKSKTHTVDVRVFLAIIITAMALAFGIGVVVGPTPTPIPASDTLTSSSSDGIPNDTEKITNARRQQTKHATEIGKKITNVDLNEKHVNFQQPVLEDFGDGTGAVKYDATATADGKYDEEHLPAGQHLLVDIMNVEAAFLNSETRLADAMVESVRGAGLTMLSYHCHSLLPAGVSCVGVLLESHISFHTWPDEGVITLDLFTCGPKPLLPVIKDLERLFGIPRNKPNSEEKEEILSQWSHELRGFRNSESGGGHLDNKSDLAVWVVSPMIFGIKKEVVSINTEHQRIDIWEYLPKESTPSHQDALDHNLQEGDPRWLTSEIASPDVFLFLDGAIQSMKDSEKEFHETLVHPAMFTHSKPKNVAVIGGGEGSTVRELLKHESVESVTVIEIDSMMIDIAREHLAYMSDCSDIEGLADSCFDDERTNIINSDATAWFKEHYGPEATNKGPVPSFDVIILDAFDPKQGSEMYRDSKFLDALFASMSADGIFSLHVGNPHTIHDPKPDMGVYAPREEFFQLLESHPSTAAMMVYEEAHAGFDDPHAFLTVCKDAECRSNWYASTETIDDEIYERTRRTKSEQPTLLHFDGATHHSYQSPPRAWETVYCRREPTPVECAYRALDMNKKLVEVEDDEGNENFQINSDDKSGVKSVFANVDISKGSYIMPSDIAASVSLSDEVVAGLEDNINVQSTGEVTVIENFLAFIYKNGHRSRTEGINLNYVEVGATTFIRKTDEKDATNVGRWVPTHPGGQDPVFSPVYDRHRLAFDLFLVATKDIKAGEEIVRPVTF
mmetsp:Transcript_10224/g.15428  ORF Transcript_10224/g.15428 Transcript_10224/m.15428 type:complete len:794 (-) Transcript_10224:149-2530(-)